jgi:hypothetical protein
MEAFKNALGRIGFSEPTQEAFVLEGFDSIGSLNFATKESLKTICKNVREGGKPPALRANATAAQIAARDLAKAQQLNAMQEIKLQAMHHWVTTLSRQNAPIDADSFDNEVAMEFASVLRMVAEKSTDKDDSLLTKPEKFGTASKWIPFDKILSNYLGSRTGKNAGAPLEYIVREHGPPAAEGTEFTTEHERLVLTTPHTGAAYNEDNGNVWTLIKQLTLDGPAWAYISKYDKKRDARKAILALRAHYEGDTAMSKTKADAYAVLKHTVWKTETRNWTFEQYITLLSRAHQTLEEYGEPVAESKKVQDLLDGIEPNAFMVAGIAQVMADPAKKRDFTEASNYLSQFVSTNKVGGRRIAEMRTDERDYEGSGYGGRGGGRGRGRGHGRGRGRGRGQDREGKGNIPIKAGSYSDSDWHKLGYDGQQKVWALRDEERGDSNGKRNASALRTDDDQEARVEEEPEAESGDVGNAGDQFAIKQKAKAAKKTPQFK